MTESVPEAVQKVVAAVNGSGDYTVPFLINGEEIRSSQTFDIVSPATGKFSHKCSTATPKEATSAIEAAAAALKEWSATTPRQRRDIFLKASDVFEQRRKELAQYMVDETGADEGWANFNLDLAKDIITDVAGRVSSLEGSIPTPADPTVGALVLKEPYGVVLAIAPWNAPYVLGIRSVAFPLAAGNTVVLKGSELSPRVMWGICSVLHEAGVPKGALNLVVSDPSNAAAVTETLVAHPEVKKINFTGSTGVGRIIGRLAGENLKPVLLELGGKAPAIVWEDADLDLAADQCALGSFLNAGQICMSTERILVHKKVRGEFEGKFMKSVEKFFSKEKDAPILIQERGVEKAKKLVRDAKAKGATLAGADVDVEESSKTRMRPIVVSGVTEEMDIYKQESFGPTVSLIEVETEEEALRIANDTEYGLSSAVFTEDLRRGLRFAKGIETGACHINNMSVHDESALPHGGAKASGYGRFNAAAGLENWVRTKTITYRV